MSFLRDLYRILTSCWKKRSSAWDDTLSNATDHVRGIEHSHHQQWQWRDDNGSSIDLEAAAAHESKPQCGLDGFLGITELQTLDSAYRMMPDITNIWSYAMLHKSLRIEHIWKEVVAAIKSGNRRLAEELLLGLERLCEEHNDSIWKQSQISRLARPNKAIAKKFIHEMKNNLGMDAEDVEADPSRYRFYEQQDMLDTVSRRILEFNWVQRILIMFKVKTVIGEHSDYIHFADEAVFAIKMSLMLFIVMFFIYVPVIIPVLGVVSTPVGIAVLYAAFVALSCVATTCTLDVNTALAVKLAYAAILGNVLLQKNTA